MLKDVILNKKSVFETFKTAVVFDIPELCKECVQWLNYATENSLMTVDFNVIEEMIKVGLIETIYNEFNCY